MDDSPIIHAFKHMQLPLMIVGPEGKIVHCNRAMNQMFGYDDNDLMGRPVFDILPIKSVSEFDALIEPPAVDAVVKGMIGRGRDGSPVPLAFHMTAWTDKERGVQYALVLRDITDEMEAVRLSKDELKRANSAIRGARIGVFEYNPITDVTIVSDIWRELMEIDAQDTVNVQQEWLGRVHPEELDMMMEAIQSCLDGVEDRTSCEHRLRSKDGTQWRWMNTDIAIAKRGADGSVTRLIGAMTEITKRKAAENALRKSEEQFRSAFESAVVGKAIIGLDGKLLRVNPALCKLLGYPEANLLSRDVKSLTHPEDLANDLLKRKQLMSGEISAYQTEKRYIREDGAVLWCLLSVGTVTDASGRPEQFITQVMDITEQRRLSELKNEFVAIVSHELRTPLTSILGSLSLLSSMDTEPFSDSAQRLLFIAQENGKRLHDLVNDILDFGKFTAHQMRFATAKHSVSAAVEEAALTNMATADKYGVRFRFDSTDRSMMAYFDPKRMQQAMTNLLTNAAKFAKEDSTVDVFVEEQPDVIRISVVNEGDGIPDAFRDQIFKPFSQAAPSATRSRGGTGLGLSITKQIVEQTGGTIGFDSEEDGQTTFWFTVPVDAQIDG